MALLDVCGKVALLGVHLVTLIASKHQLLVSSSHVIASALRGAKGGRAFEALEVFVAVRVLHVSSKMRLFVALEVTFIAFKLLVSVQGSQWRLNEFQRISNVVEEHQCS